MPEVAATMPAAVYRGPGDIAVSQEETPPVGPTDALIEVAYCGICGTDLHLVIEGWGQPGSVPGHEYSGRLAAIGDGASGWQVGDPVVALPQPECGTCTWCRAGRPSLCRDRGVPGLEWRGAFARYIRVGATQLRRVPAELSLREAALTEPLAVALHALTVGRVRAGSRVLVSGAGPIGLLAVAAMRAQGVDDVVVCEPNPGRRELAVAVGATAAVTPADLPEASPLPTELVPEPFDVVLECSGRKVAAEAGLGQLGPAGTLVIVGTGLDRPSFDPNRVLLNELVITGAYNYDAHGFDAALDLLASGRLPVDRLIEPDTVTLDGILDAMERLGRGELLAKVLVTPG